MQPFLAGPGRTASNTPWRGAVPAAPASAEPPLMQLARTTLFPVVVNSPARTVTSLEPLVGCRFRIVVQGSDPAPPQAKSHSFLRDVFGSFAGHIMLHQRPVPAGSE